jgi:hypothetical protein
MSKQIDLTKLSLEELKSLVANYERLKATDAPLYREAKALLEKRPTRKAAVKKGPEELPRRPGSTMTDAMDDEIRNAHIRRGYVAGTTPELGLERYDSMLRVTRWPSGWRASGIYRGTTNRIPIESEEDLARWEAERAEAS